MYIRPFLQNYNGFVNCLTNESTTTVQIRLMNSKFSRYKLRIAYALMYVYPARLKLNFHFLQRCILSYIIFSTFLIWRQQTDFNEIRKDTDTDSYNKHLPNQFSCCY